MGGLDKANGSVNSASRRRVTIIDVADALGLTKSTVSRAMNGYPDISERTRMRVDRMAAEMGYRPLVQAQAIRTGRVRALGFVLQSDLHDGYRPFLSEFLAGLTQAAGAESWTLTVASAAGSGAVLDTYERLVDERKVDGFVLPRTRPHDERIALLRRLEVPFVLFGRTEDDEGCAWYDILGEDAMREAVLRLAAAGHRRIAHVGALSHYYYARLREEGYRQGLSEAGLKLDPRLITRDAVSREDGADATRRLLALDEPPTAIVAAVDMAALGVCREINRAGLTVGQDISVVSYDGIPEADHADPPLSTFVVDTRTAGERLATLLIRRIRGEAPEDLRETAKARLVARGSDGPMRLTSDEIAQKLKIQRRSEL